MSIKKARIIAFYLPQFHPIPENDKYWGKGFTEWTNVARARPLFKGHYQPKIPADLGFYDLRSAEVRELQANLAREAGIEGFCYWHYWFGNGKELLEKPINVVIDTGKPDFPFCLGWANHSWTTQTWTATNSQFQQSMIAEQTYPGSNDHILHFNKYLKAFKDPRYIKVDGKLLFVVFASRDIPNFGEFKNLWNKLAQENGLTGFHFVGMTENFIVRIDNGEDNKYKIPNIKNMAEENYKTILNLGYNAVNSRGSNRAQVLSDSILVYYAKRFLMKFLRLNFVVKYDYKDIIIKYYVPEDSWNNVYPTIIPNFDRSPRSGKKTTNIWYNSTPQLFKKQINMALELIKNKPDEHKILFLQSWNEWGEGNYVEPDLKYGHQFLDELKKSLS